MENIKNQVIKALTNGLISRKDLTDQQISPTGEIEISRHDITLIELIEKDYLQILRTKGIPVETAKNLISEMIKDLLEYRVSRLKVGMSIKPIEMDMRYAFISLLSKLERNSL